MDLTLDLVSNRRRKSGNWEKSALWVRQPGKRYEQRLNKAILLCSFTGRLVLSDAWFSNVSLWEHFLFHDVATK